MYKQISTSSEPSIIGVTNGIFQIEIDENSIESNRNIKQLGSIFNQINVFEFLDNQHKLFDLKINPIKGSLLSRANITDLMGYSPFYFGFYFVVSQKFIDCLNRANVSSNEYLLFNFEVPEINEDLYFFFVPMIPTSEIIFNKSKIFLEKDFLEKDREVLNINTLGEFQEYTMKNPFVDFDKVCLSIEYKNRDIINIQTLNNLFFSQRLIDEIKEMNISNFVIPNRQTELAFFVI